MPKKINPKRMVELLNRALVHEQTGQIRYLAHAAVVTGLHAEPIIARLKELAEDEAGHASMLRDRIVALGGTPHVAVEPSEVPHDTMRILQINLRDERDAVGLYQRLFRMIPRQELILYECIEHILEDEQEHVEELSRLCGR